MAVLLVVFVIVAFFMPFILISKWRNRYGNSDFDDIIFLNNKIYLLSNVFHSGGDGDSYTDCRIREIDPKTGEITNVTVTIYSRLKVLGVLAGNIWVADDTFAVFDPKSFKFIFKQKEIGQILEELNGVKVQRFYLNEVEQKFYFIAENGYKYSIDPVNFNIKRFDFEQSEQIVKKTRKKQDQSAFSIKKVGKTERYDLYYNNENISVAKSFLQPEFLVDSKTKEWAALENPDSIVLFHCDTLNNMSPFNLSSISSNGQVLWTIKQEELDVKHNFESDYKAKIEFVNFKSPLLTIVFKGKRSRLVCIDIKEGKVLWIVKI